MGKITRKCLFFFIIFSIIWAYFSTCYAGTISTNINGIDESTYPGIKAKIQALKNAHPNWTIQVEYTNLTWAEAVFGEHQNHGARNDPKSLVPANKSNYAGLWICEICGKEKCDTGSWYCASKEAIKYMMDPRNSLNETDVFQFMQLSSSKNYTNDTTTKNILKNMAATTNYLNDECINAILSAATTYHVDPYYIMAKIIGEQGTSVKPLIAGNGYKNQYKGVYNFFNIGATGNTGEPEAVIRNGLAYAASQGWTTRTKSIMGGTKIISQNYIAKEQDTLYYQKFNVVGSNLYNHQYQQNILAAQNEGTSLRKTYLKMDPKLSGKYTFTIPLYKRPPKSPCARPSTTSSYTISNIKKGDVNSDNKINIQDVVSLINHLQGSKKLTGNNLEAAKLTGNSNVTITDAVLLINYLQGSAVLPSGGCITGKISSNNTVISLTPAGNKFKTVGSSTSIKVLKKATSTTNGAYWDLIVTSNGIYGYINRNNWK